MMKYRRPVLLAAGVIAATFAAAPLTASAGSNDEALAFVAGAVVGHVIGSHDLYVRHAHRPHRHEPVVRYGRPLHWKARPYRFHRRIERGHTRFDDRHSHRRHERRPHGWDRRRHRDRDHERRDHRRGGRRH